MREPVFRFRQFTVRHDRCAMKVGTDGSLLGAWCGKGQSPKKILDIGTGSGLIALMCAQRFEKAQITGIEIEENCASQAKENAMESPWAERIEIFHQPLQAFEFGASFDLIVCNPPYFSRAYRSGNSQRDLARHDDKLPSGELIAHAQRLIAPDGLLSLILPEDRVGHFLSEAESRNFHLYRSLQVRGSESGSVKRHLFELSPRKVNPLFEDEIYLEKSGGGRSDVYSALMRDFYL